MTAETIERREVRLLRSAVGLIRTNGRMGTGFLVRRGIMVTCAHVVDGPDSPVDITIGDVPYTGRVLERIPRSATGTYPFPDLAFIGIDQAMDLPVAEFDSSADSGRRSGHPVRAFGYNRETPEPEPILDEVDLVLAGRSDRFLKATSVGVVRGMSGGPVFDPNTGLVVGILKHQRRDQEAVWLVDGRTILAFMANAAKVINRFHPERPRLLRPEPGDPLYDLLTAQRIMAERLPYQVVKGEVRLSSVYVELRADAWRSEVRRAIARGEPPPPEPTVLAAEDMLDHHRNALLIAGPGGGKSTLLQHLVLESAAWWLNPTVTRSGDEPAFGPAVAIRCPATALAGSTAWTQLLADAVNAELRGALRVELTAEMFDNPPAPNAEWLVLVDALDEVPDPYERADLIAILAQRVAEYGRHRFVVTSRHLDENEFQLLRSSLAVRQEQGDRLGEYDLRPFDRQAVVAFAQRWFELRTPDRAGEMATGFLGRVDQSRLMPLMAIPLLCTIAADVYQRSPDQPLPPGRSGLYSRFVAGLVEGRRGDLDVRDWLAEQLHRFGRRVQNFGEDFFDRRLDCITALAVEHLRGNKPTVERAREWLAANGLPPPWSIKDDHIREVLLSTGLVVLRSGELQFTHQSIAEYLASGEDIEDFSAAAWQERVEVVGAESTSLFTLDRWAAAGHDPMPLVDALGAPGPAGTFDRLPDLAAVLQDGAGLVGERMDRAVDVAVHAIRHIVDASEVASVAVAAAMRAVVQRASTVDIPVSLVDDEGLSVAKRVAGAKAMVEVGDPDETATGLDRLAAIAYRSAISNLDRLVALRALVEVAPYQERRRALQHLAQIVATSRRDELRASAVHALAAVDEHGEAALALFARCVDPWRTEVERAQAVAEFATIWSEYWDTGEGTYQPTPTAFQGPLPEGYAWTADEPVRPVSRTFGVPAQVYELAWTAAVALAVDPVRANHGVAALLHNRSLAWGHRMHLAWLLTAAADRPRSTALHERLAEDPRAPAATALVHRYLCGRHTHRAETAEWLIRTAEGNRADPTARVGALEILLHNNGSRVVPLVQAIAGDAGAPGDVRLAAAAMLARHDFPAEAVRALTALTGAPELPWRWRWFARIMLRFIPGEPSASSRLPDTPVVERPRIPAPRGASSSGVASSGPASPLSRGGLSSAAGPGRGVAALRLTAVTVAVAAAVAPPVALFAAAAPLAIALLTALGWSSIWLAARTRLPGLVAFAYGCAATGGLGVLGPLVARVDPVGALVLTATVAIAGAAASDTLRRLPTDGRRGLRTTGIAVGLALSTVVAGLALARSAVTLGLGVWRALDETLFRGPPTLHSGPSGALVSAGAAWLIVLALVIGAASIALLSGHDRVDAALVFSTMMVLALAGSWWSWLRAIILAAGIVVAMAAAVVARRPWSRLLRIAAGAVLVAMVILDGAGDPRMVLIATAIVLPGWAAVAIRSDRRAETPGLSVIGGVGAALLVVELAGSGPVGELRFLAFLAGVNAVIVVVLRWLASRTVGLPRAGLAFGVATFVLLAVSMTAVRTVVDGVLALLLVIVTIGVALQLARPRWRLELVLELPRRADLRDRFFDWRPLRLGPADRAGHVDRPGAVDRTGPVDRPGSTDRPGAVDRPDGEGDDLLPVFAVLLTVATVGRLAAVIWPGSSLMVIAVLTLGGLVSVWLGLIPPPLRFAVRFGLGLLAGSGLAVMAVLVVIELFAAVLGGPLGTASVDAFLGWQLPVLLALAAVASRLGPAPMWRLTAPIWALTAIAITVEAGGTGWPLVIVLIGLAVVAAYRGRPTVRRQAAPALIAAAPAFVAATLAAGTIGILIWSAAYTLFIVVAPSSLGRWPRPGLSPSRPTSRAGDPYETVPSFDVNALAGFAPPAVAIVLAAAGSGSLRRLTIAIAIFGLLAFVAAFDRWANFTVRRWLILGGFLGAESAAVLLALWSGGVRVVEAYSLLIAAGFTVRGAFFTTQSSWRRFGIALAAAFGPTAVYFLAGAAPLARAIGLVVAGTLVYVVGRIRRQQAPLVVGRGVVLLVAAVMIVKALIALLPASAAPFVVAAVVVLAVAYDLRLRSTSESTEAALRSGLRRLRR